MVNIWKEGEEGGDMDKKVCLAFLNLELRRQKKFAPPQIVYVLPRNCCLNTPLIQIRYVQEVVTNFI